MTSIDLSKETPTVEELLILAQKNADVLLTRRGRPLARLVVLPEKPAQRVAPLHPGAWEVSPDFDAPLTEDFLLGRS